MKPLPREFYQRSALEVAPDLLGKILCHRQRGVLTSGRIIEVEAYLGSKDPASHAFRGITKRNRVMFGPPGYAYVYFSYGHHYCMNVVTGEEGQASAVLIRALVPMEGIEAMKRRRKRNREKDLASGPGKLTQSLGIGQGDSGTDLTSGKLWISEDETEKVPYTRTGRVGVKHGVKLPYRFVVRA